MTIRLLTFLAVLLGTLPLSAQERVQISIPDVVALAGEAEICVPVIADSFPDIASVQFSLTWDSTEVRYLRDDFGDNPLGLSDMTTSSTNFPGNYVVTFTTNDLQGITLAPGTVMFRLCFEPTMTNGSTPITFGGPLEPEFAQAGAIVAFPFDTLPGSVRYGSDVAVSVLPGDTDDNGQVDARDLINIALAHGSGGPGRAELNTEFRNQTAPVWDENLVSGVNFAKIDGSGDGFIDGEDVALVRSYFGQSLGTFTEAPDVSTPTGPILSLEVPDAVEQSIPATFRVNLGDGNDPDAVGYALAYAFEYDPNDVDPTTIDVDFPGTFFEDNNVTVWNSFDATRGRIEVAIGRTDQMNTTLPGGLVSTITFEPAGPVDNGNFETDFRLIPLAFVRADQSAGNIQGSTTTVTVTGSTAVNEPAWGATLRLFPNPYVAGPLTLAGDLPRLTEVRVLDATGRELQRISGDVRRLDLGGLPTGAYVVQLRSAEGMVNRRVVKR